MTKNNLNVISFQYRLKEKVKNLNEYLPVDTTSFLKMFPFHIAFNRKLDVSAFRVRDQEVVDCHVWARIT